MSKTEITLLLLMKTMELDNADAVLSKTKQPHSAESFRAINAIINKISKD